MPAVDIGGVALDYVEQGSGPGLAFVHGGMNDRRVWALQMGPFAQQYRVVAYTRRHHHGSEEPAPNGQSSVTTGADDLIMLIERLELAPAHLVGSSYGAHIALMAAVKRPDLVRTLVLGEPAVGHVLMADPSVRPVWEEFRTEAWEPARARIVAGDLADGLRIFVDAVSGAGTYDRLPPPIQQILLDNASTAAVEAEPLEVFDEAEAARVTMPVLLVTGQRSPPMFHLITERLQRLLPHAKRIDIPNASHGMQADNAPAYNEMVLDFLKGA